LHRPANDTPREQIKHHCQVKSTFVGTDIRDISGPRLIWCFRTELVLQQICNNDMCNPAAVARPPITYLRPQSCGLQQTINSVLAAMFTIFTQVAETLPISIYSTALKPELLNQSAEPFIGNSPFRTRLVRSCVIAAGMNIKQVTKNLYWPFGALGLAKGVP